MKFIQGYTNLTKPLTDLSNKNVPFDWTPFCDHTFEALKHSLTPASVLAFPDLDKPFELVCDGLGAVLLQVARPLEYYSQKMTAAERNHVATEQKLLATIEGLHGFRCYLLPGKYFNMVTDNRRNTFLQTQPIFFWRQARWSKYLQLFNFSWVHRSGRRNVADPLGRNPKFKHLNALLAVITRSSSGNFVRGSRGKQSVQDLHSDPTPDTAALHAGQNHKMGASTPATGAKTTPLNTSDSSTLLALLLLLKL